MAPEFPRPRIERLYSNVMNTTKFIEYGWIHFNWDFNVEGLL
ncbi:36812_t:CDS:2, partial [Racocetra persica]